MIVDKIKKREPTAKRKENKVDIPVGKWVKCDKCKEIIYKETIREKALKFLQDEVPHGIYVEVEKMKLKKTQKKEEFYDIEATIYCLRESHKGIIIGKDGSMLKRIGQAARIDMENNFGIKVNLKTWVKVKKDWQDDTAIVKKFKLQ